MRLVLSIAKVRIIKRTRTEKTVYVELLTLLLSHLSWQQHLLVRRDWIFIIIVEG